MHDSKYPITHGAKAIPNQDFHGNIGNRADLNSILVQMIENDYCFFDGAFDLPDQIERIIYLPPEYGYTEIILAHPVRIFRLGKKTPRLARMVNSNIESIKNLFSITFRQENDHQISANEQYLTKRSSIPEIIKVLIA